MTLSVLRALQHWKHFLKVSRQSPLFHQEFPFSEFRSLKLVFVSARQTDALLQLSEYTIL